MKNFLKVLLLGTILVSVDSFAQAPGFEGAWAAATRSGYGNDSAAAGLAKTATTTVKTTTSAAKNTNLGDALDTFYMQHDLLQDTSSINSWVDSTGKVVGQNTSSTTGWFTNEAGKVVNYEIVNGTVKEVSASAASTASAATTGATSGTASTAANLVRYTSEESALHAGMEGAGIISLQDLGNGTTKVVFNNGSSLVEEMPISEVRSALIPNNAVYPGSSTASADTSAFYDKFVSDNLGKGVYGDTKLNLGEYGDISGSANVTNINNTYNIINSDGATVQTAAGDFQKGVGNTLVNSKGETVGTYDPVTNKVSIKGTELKLLATNTNAAMHGAVGGTVAAALAAKSVYMGATEAGAKLAGYATQAANASMTQAAMTSAVQTATTNVPRDMLVPAAEQGFLSSVKNFFRGDTSYLNAAGIARNELDKTATAAANQVFNGEMPDAMAQAMADAGKSAEEIAATGSEIASLSTTVKGEATAAAEAAGAKGSEAVKAVEAGQQEAAKELGEEAGAKGFAEMFQEKTLTLNVPEYAMGILEALEANKTDTITQQVNVKAQEFQESQGAQFESKLVAVEENPMTAVTVADATASLITLLKNNKIDLGLLSLDSYTETPTVSSGSSLTGASSQTVIGNGGSGSSSPSSRPVATRERAEIKRRRNLLLGEWAAAAAQIGEGSNAICRTFYDRVDDFVRSANNATGTLGGLSAMNDSDRFVLFEMTRGAALSAVELGLKGAVNLTDLEEVVATTTTEN